MKAYDQFVIPSIAEGLPDIVQIAGRCNSIILLREPAGGFYEPEAKLMGVLLRYAHQDDR